MNSLYKMCKSIDSKLDKINKRIDYLETKLDTIETYCLNDKLPQQNSIHTEGKLSSTKSKIKIKTKKQKKISSPSKIDTSVIEKSGAIHMDIYTDKTIITGDTFKKKMFIKKYKGHWSPEHKGWIVLNSQNIRELQTHLKQLSTTFTSTKHKHNINGGTDIEDYDKDTQDINTLQVPQQYAFIKDE